MHDWVSKNPFADVKTGFISTMGAIHEGHLSLVRKAREMSGQVVVMVFQNPMLQLDEETVSALRQDREKDLSALEGECVDLAFLPPTEAMYAPGHRTFVHCDRLIAQFSPIESKPYILGLATGFFQQLNLFKPSFFFVGQKNYLDFLLLKRVIRDYNMSTEAVLCPTVRDENGLAYSSFHRFFSPEERRAALAPYAVLKRARELLMGGESSPARILEEMGGELSKVHKLDVLFAGVLHPTTMEPLQKIDQEALVMVTARVGKYRVTDNILYRQVRRA